MHLSPIQRSAQRGFSMIEVAITIVLVSVGLLGAAKMQAAAVSSTQIARTRSLVALHTSSLASAMHANPLYWGTSGTPSAQFQVSGTTISGDASGVLNTSGGAYLDCTTNQCTQNNLAAYDVQVWANQMAAAVPNYAATITCTPVGTIQFENCNIVVTWTEGYVAINRGTASAAVGGNQTALQTYVEYVTP